MLDLEMVTALRQGGGAKRVPVEDYLCNVSLSVFFSPNFVDAILEPHDSGEPCSRSFSVQRARFALIMAGKLSVVDIVGRKKTEFQKKIDPLSIEQLLDLEGMDADAAALVLDMFEALGLPLRSDPEYKPRDRTPKDVAHVLAVVLKN